MEIEKSKIRDRRKRKKSSRSTSSSSSEERKKRNKDKSIEKKKKHRRTFSSSEDRSPERKIKKKKKKHKSRKEVRDKPLSKTTDINHEGNCVKTPPLSKKRLSEPQKSHINRSMAPMTKEEYERQQSIVRRVYDPETGRNRLVKGDGEILEEIVSYARHKEINKMSTKQDGESFAASIGLKR